MCPYLKDQRDCQHFDNFDRARACWKLDSFGKCTLPEGSDSTNAEKENENG
jgi:hypothetical protein